MGSVKFDVKQLKDLNKPTVRQKKDPIPQTEEEPVEEEINYDWSLLKVGEGYPTDPDKPRLLSRANGWARINNPTWSFEIQGDLIVRVS